MFSTRCNSCQQLISLNNDEIAAAIAEAEAGNSKFYEMKCPKCRKRVRIQVRMLKLKLPREVPESLDGKAAAQDE